MFYILIGITLVIGGISSIPTDDLSQSRNVAFQFREMITAVTGRSAFDYLGYGCHCGLGGKGKTVDGVDMCCKVHDQCYADTSTYLQFWNLCSPHLVGFSWKNNNGIISCNDKPDTCAYKTCMCDKQVAECFARNTYNDKHKGYSQSQCS